MAQYIHRAIGSSLRQTHKNIEILIIDDGSTDDTLKVAEYFAGTFSRIRVLSQKNAGVSAARNYGIREAKGEYLYFLDADDWLEDDALEILLAAQMEHPDCIICSNFYWGVEIEGSNLILPENIGKTIPPCYMNLKDIAEVNCFVRKFVWIFHCIHAKLFRSPFSARFPEGVIHSEDAAFFTEYFMQSGRKAYYINKPILNVLRRIGSATRSKYKSTMLDSEISAYKVITDVVDDEECRNLMLMSRERQIYSCFLLAVSTGADRKEIKRIKSALRPSAWLSIKCKRYPARYRLRLFLAVFAPLPVYKAVISMWNFLKSLRGKKEAVREVIKGWQDFPKAPGV